MRQLRYFTDESMIRRVHREQMLGLYGPRALLMQATHPVAFAGFFAHSGALDEPYERLRRTAETMNTITFGSRADADRMTRRVRAMHRRVRGELSEPAGRFPAGTPYAADDPELLLWVLATLADSALVVYQRYVGGLDRGRRDAFWQDDRVVGRLFGLRDDEMPAVRPLLEMANFVTVGLLPCELRRQYGLHWDPARGLALHGGTEYLKRVLVALLPRRVRWVSGARAA